MLNDHQLARLHSEGDGPDITVLQARSLNKALGQRKRTTPNIFTTLSGKAQPRQGFLSVEILRAVYLRSELVRACVDTLIEFVCRCDWTIRPVDKDASKRLKQKNPEKYLDQQKRIKWATKFFKRPNGYENLDSFHRKFIRDLLIFDAAAYEIVRAQYDSGAVLPVELGAIAGDTVEIECDDHGIPARYWQSYNVLNNVAFDRDELAYVQLNPCTWQPYGISAIETAFVAITADLSGNKHNADIFSKNNIPPGLLAVMGVSPTEFTRVMAQMRGVSADNPHNIHAFRTNRNTDGSAQKTFEYIPLQVPNREMQYKELLEYCINRVTMAFKMSPSMIGFTEQVTGGIGSGVAEGQIDIFQDKAVAPLVKAIADSHTSNVLWNVCGWEDLEFAFEQSGTPQEQAEFEKSLQEMQIGSMTINEHRAASGRKAVAWGDQPISPTVGYTPPMTPEQLSQQAMQMQLGQPPGQPGQPGQPPNQQPGQPPQNNQPPQLQKSAQKRIIIEL